MPGSDRIKAHLSGIIEKRFEFDVLVAQDVRIRCTSPTIFFQKYRKDVIPVFFDKIHPKELEPQLICYLFGIRIVLFLRTDIILDGRISQYIIVRKGIPVPHESAGHIHSLFFQAIRRHCRIHSAG